jgi:hypothetical protein
MVSEGKEVEKKRQHENETLHQYHQARKTREMERTMSSRRTIGPRTAIVPLKRGNRTHRDPDLGEEGRAVPEKRIAEGKQYGHTEVLGYAVNETAANSGSGPETSGRKFSEFGTLC